jgi:hypothetical protein
VSFSLSASTVTQTGTDTAAQVITNLGAIAGVVSTNMGGYTRLVVPYKLIINGSMTIDHTVKLSFERGGVCANEVVVNSGGTWTAKSVRTTNGTNDYYEMQSIDFNNTPSTSYNGQTGNSIYVVGGTLDFAAVRVNADGGQYWNGGVIKYRRVILSAQNVTTPNDLQYTTEVGTPTIDWDDVTIIGGSTFMRTVTITNFLNFKPRYMIAGVGLGYGASRTLTNLAPFGCQNDASCYSGGSGGTLILLDPAPGGATKIGPWAAPSNTGVYIKTTASIRITAIDEFNAVANSFKTYYLDNITGAYTGTHSGNVAGVQNTYNGTSSGNTLDMTVMTGESTLCQVLKRRSVTQTDDLFAFPLISYLNKISNSGNIDLAAINRKDKTVIMLLDTSITQTTKATVDAYTALDSSAKFYDFTKSFLFNNYLGETATYVTRSAAVINAGSYNVTINPAAGAVFAKSGSLLTIKASTYSGEIATTGTLTASMTTGGAYTYVNGSAESPMTSPIFTGGTTNIGAAGTYNFSTASTIVSMTPVAASSYTITGSHSGTLSLKNTSAFAITVTIPAGTTYTTAANVGGAITVIFPNVNIDITGLIAGSTIQIYNTTDSVELYCAVVAGTSYTHSLQYVSNKALRLRVSRQSGATAYTPFETIGTLTSSGAAITANQVASTIYNTWAIDGSAQTQYTADGPNVDIDITAGGSYTKKSLAAWWMYYLTTVAGIRAFWGAYTLESLTSIKQDITVVDVLLQNTATGTTVVFTDNDVRYYRSDFSIPYDTTPGFGSIFMDYAGVPLLPSALAATTAAAVWNSATASYPTTGTFGLSVTQTKTLAGLIPAAL